MAERRMFSKSVIDSDHFTDMPTSTQALYFHLAMRADDDGFVNNPKKIQRSIGCSDDDMRLLAAKQYIIPFESGIVVIRHWKLHNYIQKDRYKPSNCVEKQMVTLKNNAEYELDTKCIQSVSNMDTQVSIGKDRLELGKDSIGEDTQGEPSLLPPLSGDQVATQRIDYKSIQDLFNTTCKSVPGIKSITDNRKKLIRSALKVLDENGIDLKDFFEKVESSDFLTGRKSEWCCCFDWIFKKQNMQKIIEGNYDNAGNKHAKDNYDAYYKAF